MRPPVSADLQFGPGAVLLLGEQDYCYGYGPLVLCVDKLGADPRSFRRLEWVRVVGREVSWDGAEQPRDVMVRVAAIQGSLRPPGTRPPRYRKDQPSDQPRSGS